VGRHATRAKSGREGSDAEELESGDLSGTSSEKKRLCHSLFDTREELREAKQEALRLAGEIAEDDEAEDDDDDDDDDDDTHTKEEELATLRTQNAELLRKLHRKTGAATAKLSTWKPGSLHAMSSDVSRLSPNPRTFCSFENLHSTGLDTIPLCCAWAKNARCSRQRR
jgi:hypothetical protein